MLLIVTCIKDSSTVSVIGEGIFKIYVTGKDGFKYEDRCKKKCDQYVLDAKVNKRDVEQLKMNSEVRLDPDLI